MAGRWCGRSEGEAQQKRGGEDPTGFLQTVLGDAQGKRILCREGVPGSTLRATFSRIFGADPQPLEMLLPREA
jgi:hypothetical protein